MIEPQPTPSRMVNAQGQVQFGVFDAPFRELNLEDAQVVWKGVRLPRPVVRFRLKRWQHFGLVLPEVFVGLAVVNVGFLRTSWCHVVDRVAHEQFEHKRMGPWMNVGIAEALWDDHTHVHARGYRVDVHNHLSAGEHCLNLRVDPEKGKPAVHGSLRCVHDLETNRPMVVVLPVGPNQGMYSHKVALPLSGTLRVGDRLHRADPDTSFAILDIHKAHYPRHTWWKWATFAGRDGEGRSVALNLTQNVNPDDTRLNENGLWVDGRLVHLGPARFVFDRQDVLAPWRLTTADGAVDLTFHPEGERSENLRAGIIRSVFHQPYGTFAGVVRHGGRELHIEDMVGVCEDHDARW
jgi:Domain of unknown function (DUF2804), C-terminal/Domain of unknown function (DUF2804), N-terminal